MITSLRPQRVPQSKKCAGARNPGAVDQKSQDKSRSVSFDRFIRSWFEFGIAGPVEEAEGGLVGGPLMSNAARHPSRRDRLDSENVTRREGEGNYRSEQRKDHATSSASDSATGVRSSGPPSGSQKRIWAVSVMHSRAPKVVFEDGDEAGGEVLVVGVALQGRRQVVVPIGVADADEGAEVEGVAAFGRDREADVIPQVSAIPVLLEKADEVGRDGHAERFLGGFERGGLDRRARIEERPVQRTRDRLGRFGVDFLPEAGVFDPLLLPGFQNQPGEAAEIEGEGRIAQARGIASMRKMPQAASTPPITGKPLIGRVLRPRLHQTWALKTMISAPRPIRRAPAIVSAMRDYGVAADSFR